ncbi:MAG: hypothetical protein E6R03_10610 [Hyphomicrobiaceae bacterium]|nr:MAG: hypothetical protein E6R03_10610 [Hyphomicrobiaceae bacterium]
MDRGDFLGRAGYSRSVCPRSGDWLCRLPLRAARGLLANSRARLLGLCRGRLWRFNWSLLSLISGVCLMDTKHLEHIDGKAEALRMTGAAGFGAIYGLTLNEWVAVATLLYMAFQIIVISPKVWRVVKYWTHLIRRYFRA